MAEIKNIQDQISLAKKNDQNAYSYLLETFWDDVYNFQLKRTQNEINTINGKVKETQRQIRYSLSAISMPTDSYMQGDPVC